VRCSEFIKEPAMKVTTKKVVLKDGTTALINASDFDPSLHSDASKKPDIVKKRKTGRAY
jgi:hypothetical protein